MPEPKLYDYQGTHLAVLREQLGYHKNVLFQAPTGYGKTHCFTYMLYRSFHMTNATWWVMAHLVEILEEISRRFTAFDIPHSWIAAGKATGDERIKLVMRQTVINQLHHHEPPTAGIKDECHHDGPAQTKKIADYCVDTRWQGFTATPMRNDRAKLSDFYGALVTSMQRRELIAINQVDEMRGLVKPVLYRSPNSVDFSDLKPNERGEYDKETVKERLESKKVTGDLIKHYLKYAPGEKALVFDIDVESCKETAAKFTAAGIPADYIDGSMDKYTRRAKYQAFQNGSIDVLVSVNLFLEGVNIEGVTCVFWRRPTNSQIVWDQGNGRMMRPAKGKRICKCFDHVGNSYRHGRPDADRFYDLNAENQAKKKNEAGKHLIRCERCHAMFEPPSCDQCGWEPIRKPRALIEVAGELILDVGDEEIMRTLIKAKQEAAVELRLRDCATKKQCIELAKFIGRDERYGEHLWIRKHARRTDATVTPPP